MILFPCPLYNLCMETTAIHTNHHTTVSARSSRSSRKKSDHRNRQIAAIFLGALVTSSGLSETKGFSFRNETDRPIKRVPIPTKEEILSFDIRPFQNFPAAGPFLNDTACFLDAEFANIEWFPCSGLDDALVPKFSMAYYLYEKAYIPKTILSCCSNLVKKTYHLIQGRAPKSKDSHSYDCSTLSSKMSTIAIQMALAGRLSPGTEFGRIKTLACNERGKCDPTGTLDELGKMAPKYRESFTRHLQKKMVTTCIETPERQKPDSCEFYHKIVGVIFGALTKTQDCCETAREYLFPQDDSIYPGHDDL